MASDLARIPGTIIRRLGRIGIYTLMFYAVILGGREIYRAVAPGNWYLRYERYDVSSVEEGSTSVPFTACRAKTGNYDVSGARNIYRIPDPAVPSNREIAGSVPLDATTTNSRCISGDVESSKGAKRFKHTTGTYNLTVVFNFKVGRYEKRYEYTSGLYVIGERRLLSPDDIQERIEELQRQIDALRAQLSATSPSTAVAATTPSQPSSTFVIEQPVATAPPDEQPAAEESESTGLNAVLDGVTGTVTDVLDAARGLLRRVL